MNLYVSHAYNVCRDKKKALDSPRPRFTHGFEHLCDYLELNPYSLKVYFVLLSTKLSFAINRIFFYIIIL